VFPDAAKLAGLDPATLPMPLARGRALVTLASALASGDICLDPGADWEEVGAQLLALPGIGPWTAGYIRMRALSDPDVFLPGDGGVARALRRLTSDGPGSGRAGSSGSGAGQTGSNGSGAERAGSNGSGTWKADAKGGPSTGSPLATAGWRPWRSYATHHLWAVLESAQAPARGIRDDAMTAKLLESITFSKICRMRG